MVNGLTFNYCVKALSSKKSYKPAVLGHKKQIKLAV